MSGTRSPFRKAPATEAGSRGRGAIIVGHGQPSDPARAERALAQIGARVGDFLPGWHVQCATLAAPRALARAVQAHPGAVIFPMFMAAGRISQTALPRRLQSAGAGAGRILPPLGHDPRLVTLAARILATATLENGATPRESDLVLVAHGGRQGQSGAGAAHRFAGALAALVPFATIRLGFLQERPFLAAAARPTGRPALCLPLFAAAGDHVTRDIPAALREAGFGGRLLGPIGLDAGVPALIAAALCDCSRARAIA